MIEEYNKLYKKLLILFWINIVLSTAALLLVLYNNDFDLKNGGNVLFEQYSIIFTVAAIPGALKLFHYQYKKAEQLEDSIFLKKYLNSYILRLAILDAVIILNLAGIYSFDSQNALYMSLITIFALAFCYPGKKIIKERQNNTEHKDN